MKRMFPPDSLSRHKSASPAARPSGKRLQQKCRNHDHNRAADTRRDLGERHQAHAIRRAENGDVADEKNGGQT
ncbi:hypothetical protein QIH94_25130 [Bradyrhizobium japonicum]|nr:hypothetical protein [Bradyrhizobium japonicum]WLB50653.1 hypothetical protein QIH94_25130 [Bradyrhizobium japonicum]